jgi:hypothetical protein
MVVKPLKDVKHQSLGKVGNTTVKYYHYLLEGVKFKHWKHQALVSKHIEQVELFYTAGGNIK